MTAPTETCNDPALDHDGTPQGQRILPFEHRDVHAIAALPDDAYLTRYEAARLLGTAVGTLSRWASEGRGPRVTAIGIRGFVRYLKRDLTDFMQAHSRKNDQPDGKGGGRAA
jgi:hypothetical protein